MSAQKKVKQILHDEFEEETRKYLRTSQSDVLLRLLYEATIIKIFYRILHWMTYSFVPGMFFVAEFLVAWNQSRSFWVATLSGGIFFTFITILTKATDSLVKFLMA
jgi:hypothetical protein